MKASLEEQLSQGTFVLNGRQDILNTTIGGPDHGGRVRAVVSCDICLFGTRLENVCVWGCLTL